jgi:hypothetical protein
MPPRGRFVKSAAAEEDRRVLRLLFTCAIAIWLGTVVCFSWIVLPAIHRESAPGDATRLLRRLFPRYYWVGIICGFVALGTVSLGRSADALPLGEALRLALPVAGGLACSLAAQQLLLPRMREARERQPERYERLHAVSAMLNSTVVALLFLAVAGAVMR